jgi:rhodanese-related sulfurtransferase
MNRFILSSAVVLLVSIAPPVSAEEAPKPPKWMTTPVKAMVDKARAATTQVSLSDLRDAIDRNENMVILDVRNPDEYDVAHIPNAVNLPRGLLEFNIWTAVPDMERKIYVYCKTGARASLATRQLNELGYKNAVALSVGVAAWTEAGYPVQVTVKEDKIVAMAVTPAVK